jgi:hypothetical protein
MNQEGKIILSVVITGVVIVGIILGCGVYFCRQVEIIKSVISPVAEDSINSTEPSNDASASETAIVVADQKKTFQGNGFSFQYPASYVLDSYGLWFDATAYETHLKGLLEPEAFACDLCQIPMLRISFTSADITLEDYIVSELHEPIELIKKNYPYETVRLGVSEFIRIKPEGMMDYANYFIKQGGMLLNFSSTNTRGSGDNIFATQEEIISTLKFE